MSVTTNRRSMVVYEIRASEDELCAQAISQAQQRRWSCWEEAVERKVTLSELWALESVDKVHAWSNVWPVTIPANLVRWKVGC